ncbi:hypothetical protein E4T44_12764, partial [Aureobasidium sp. EXF-8845]
MSQCPRACRLERRRRRIHCRVSRGHTRQCPCPSSRHAASCCWHAPKPIRHDPRPAAGPALPGISPAATAADQRLSHVRCPHSWSSPWTPI